MSTPDVRLADSEAPDTDLYDLVMDIARALVDEPDKVDVNSVEGTTTTVYELSVAPEDVGKIIGRSGRTLRAFRTIVTAVGTKMHRKSMIEVIE